MGCFVRLVYTYYLISRPGGLFWRMNQDSLNAERTPRELLLFALAAFGLLLGVVGVVITSVSMAIFGALLMLTAVSGFAVRHWLGS